MISIKTLLDYLQALNIIYKGNYNTQINFRNIEILNGESILMDDTLYLTSDEEIVVKYLSSHRCINLKSCIILISSKEISNEDVCQIITDHSFEYIFNLVSRFILKSYSLSVKQNYIYDSFYSSDKMEDVLNIAEKYLNNPIFIVDTSYALLSRSAMAKTNNSYIDKYNQRYYLKFDIVELMKKSKCIENIYNSSKPFFYYDEENIIFCAIKINGITTAYICIQEVNKHFINSDLELVSTLSKVIASFFEKEHIFISNSGLCDEYYLIDLLSNSFNDIDCIKDRLKSSPFELKENFILISVPYAQEYKDYRYNFGLKELMQSGKNILKNCLSAYYENNIIFLVSTSEFNVITDSVKNQLEKFLKLNNLKCGISYVFNDLNNIHDYLIQSHTAVKLSSKSGCDDIISYFEDYIDYYLFSIADSKSSIEKISLKTLIHPFITKLIDYDSENNSELFKTFKAYFENHKNSENTAKSLNINRSTFFYRFHKIEKVLNTDINSYSYKLKVALQLHKFISQH